MTFFSAEDLRHFPLSQLYEERCKSLKVKANLQVLQQLPQTIGFQYRLNIINCGQTYLGSRGVVALCSVVQACPRLTHLNLEGCGMKAAAAKTLLAVLAVHPGIMFLNVSKNELGTTCGQLLLALVTNHRRICEVKFNDTLLIDPIRRKIDHQLEQNFRLKGHFSVPLIPEDSDDIEMVKKREREAEEAARAARELKLKQEMLERLPEWGPAALLEFSDMLKKHRLRMEDILSVFDRGLREPSAEVGDFQRACRILGIRTLSNEPSRCTEFADFFAAWDRNQQKINYVAVINSLRQHARFRLPSGDEVDAGTLHRKVVDQIFDRRVALKEAFEILDIDMTGKVQRSEAIVGVLSVVGAEIQQAEGGSSTSSDNEEAAQRVVRDSVASLIEAFAGGERSGDQLLPYREFLNCFTIDAEDQTEADPQAAASKWMFTSRSDLLLLAKRFA